MIIQEQQPEFYFVLWVLLRSNWVGGSFCPAIGVESSLLSTFLAITSKASEMFAELMAETSTNSRPYVLAKL